MASSVDTYRLVQDMKAADVPEGQAVAMLYAAIEAADRRLEGMDDRIDDRIKDTKKDLTLTVYKTGAIVATVILAAIGIATSIILAAQS